MHTASLVECKSEVHRPWFVALYGDNYRDNGELHESVYSSYKTSVTARSKRYFYSDVL